MFSAAQEREILLLNNLRDNKTQAPAKTPAGDQRLIRGQREPETGLEGLGAGRQLHGGSCRERTGLQPISSPSLALERASLMYQAPSKGLAEGGGQPVEEVVLWEALRIAL